MATVINTTTKEVRRSVNTPDYPPPEWVVVNQATLDAIPAKYRKIVGGELVEMDAAEKSAVDQAELAAAIARKVKAMFDEGVAYVEENYPGPILTMGHYLLNVASSSGDTDKAATLGQLPQMALDVMTIYKQAANAARAATSMAELDAVTVDYTQVTIPDVDVAALAGVE
jgi:hypothetical protein